MSPAPDTAPSFVLLGTPDVHGSLRGKVLTAREFEAVGERGFASLSDLVLALDPADEPITTLSEVGIMSGAPDLMIRPETQTLAPLSWLPSWAICIGTPLWPDGSVCELGSRVVLERVLGGPTLAGLTLRAAFEYEVRVWDRETDEPVTSGPQYSLIDGGRVSKLIEDVQGACDALGIDFRVAHTEAGPGLLEFNMAPADGVRAADEAALFKTCLKLLAAARGLRASFLAKPFAGEEGSSGHLHLSIWDGENNLFEKDERGPQGISPAMASAVAGLLGSLPAMSVLYNPTINSYKRLVPGYFAPVNASWGFDNRVTAVRAIMSTPGATRLELRRPGADANPYLALAAAAAAMASGIREALEPMEPTEAEAFPLGTVALPGSLEAAIVEARADPALPQLLGEAFWSYYCTTREWELAAWQRTVTDWERRRYEDIV